MWVSASASSASPAGPTLGAAPAAASRSVNAIKVGPGVVVTHHPGQVGHAFAGPNPHRLFERVEHQVRLHRRRRSPARDGAGASGEDEGPSSGLEDLLE